METVEFCHAIRHGAANFIIRVKKKKVTAINIVYALSSLYLFIIDTRSKVKNMTILCLKNNTKFIPSPSTRNKQIYLFT